LEKGGQISGGGGAGGGWDSIYENDQSDKVNDIEKSAELFKGATEITGAVWPEANQVKSPCPTLKVIGAISSGMTAREEMKRMRDRPGFDADGNPIQLDTKKKAVLVADKVVGSVLGNTVGRVGGFVKRRLLGKLPDQALTGSFQEELQQAAHSPEEATPEVAKLQLLGKSLDDAEAAAARVEQAVSGAVADAVRNSAAVAAEDLSLEIAEELVEEKEELLTI
jgi:hypothetical protein